MPIFNLNTENGGGFMNRISNHEMKHILKKATQSAREEARKNGVAAIYGENGKMIKEYPNGRKTEIVFTKDGEQEVEYNG